MDPVAKQLLDEPYDLSQEQIDFYRANGFVRIKGFLLPAVLAALAPAVEAAVAAAAAPPLEDDVVYAAAFKQVINVWRTQPAVRDFVLSARLGRAAAALLGVRGVRLYHDQEGWTRRALKPLPEKALFKGPAPAGAPSGHTPWHADAYYWPLATDKTVTAWVPLEAVPPEAGPLCFAAGSHAAGLGRGAGIGAGSDAALGAAVAARGLRVARGGFDAGEVSFHAGWTLHRAAANRSGRVRRVMTAIYFDADARAAAPANDNQRLDFERYLAGARVGGACDGPLTPVAWSA